MPKPESSEVKYPLQAIATAMFPTAYSRIRSQPMIQAIELAQRRVRVGVGAAGLRDHRGQLGVAQRREPADDAEQDEREDQRRTGAVADDLAARERFAGGRGADGREDPGADDRADREHDQIAGAEHALQRVRVLRESARRWVCGETADSCEGSNTGERWRGIKPFGREPANGDRQLEARCRSRPATSPPRGSNASPTASRRPRPAPSRTGRSRRMR